MNHSQNLESNADEIQSVLIENASKTKKEVKKILMGQIKVNGEYIIDGSSYKGKASLDFLIGTWWNHSIIEAPAQISAVSGRIIDQKVTFLGKETIKLNGKTFNTLHFNFNATTKWIIFTKNCHESNAINPILINIICQI